MMKNKVIVKAVFPSIDKEYDIKIPVNEAIWRIKKLTTKAIYDMSGLPIDIKKDNFLMINKTTGQIYDNNSVLIANNIRNGTELVFIKETK